MNELSKQERKKAYSRAYSLRWYHANKKVINARRATNPKIKAYSAKYYAANKELIRMRKAVWRASNQEQIKISKAKWGAENREHKRIMNAAWFAAHPYNTRNIKPEKRCAYQAKRRSKKLNATPSWANEFVIGEAYSLARLRTKVMGFKWHVDHIVPLLSKIVCGLHCEQNLQVIPATQNIMKKNVQWPNMP